MSSILFLQNRQEGSPPIPHCISLAFVASLFLIVRHPINPCLWITWDQTSFHHCTSSTFVSNLIPICCLTCFECLPMTTNLALYLSSLPFSFILRIHLYQRTFFFSSFGSCVSSQTSFFFFEWSSSFTTFRHCSMLLHLGSWVCPSSLILFTIRM